MANETTLPIATQPASNGHSPSDKLTKLSEVETPVLRAARVFSGDIRPDDYLSVAEDVIEFVADSEVRTGTALLPENRQKMILDLAFQAHHAGNIVLTHHTPDGVIVLAVGADEIDRVLESLLPDKQSLTRTEYPALMIEDRPPL